MLNYTDIHCHMLCGVDDGAEDEHEMFTMLDMAYTSGTRKICLTPHYNIDVWGDNIGQIDKAFVKLKEYSAEKYPDMQLFRGNELFYYSGSIKSLNKGSCRTLNGSRYVLVDFCFDFPYYIIKNGLVELLNSGYIPVFAHAERYDCIKSPFEQLRELKKFGVLIQVNSSSLTDEENGIFRKKTMKILKAGLADIVASDSHNTFSRHPRLNYAETLINKHFGKKQSELLLRVNPNKVLGLK